MMTNCAWLPSSSRVREYSSAMSCPIVSVSALPSSSTPCARNRRLVRSKLTRSPLTAIAASSSRIRRASGWAFSRSVEPSCACGTVPDWSPLSGCSTITRCVRMQRA